MSKSHYWLLKTCWQNAIKKSFLLNSSDISIYLNTNEENRNEAVSFLENLFHNRNLKIYFPVGKYKVKNTTLVDSLFAPKNKSLLNDSNHLDKQYGAMQALSDASNEGWFYGYDWVIRLNPDVIIRNETALLKILFNDLNATAALVDCWKFRRKKEPSLPILIHTDFFAIRPDSLPKNVFSVNFETQNAEASFTKQIENYTLKKGSHRWVPNNEPLSPACRVGDNQNLNRVSVIHFHPKKNTMKSKECPIPF